MYFCLVCHRPTACYLFALQRCSSLTSTSFSSKMMNDAHGACGYLISRWLFHLFAGQAAGWIAVEKTTFLWLGLLLGE